VELGFDLGVPKSSEPGLPRSVVDADALDEDPVEGLNLLPRQFEVPDATGLGRTGVWNWYTIEERISVGCGEMDA